MRQLSPVTFHGDTIFCIDYQNQPFTPAKPIVENLGLGWASQSQKLNANKERWGITIIVIPSESGDQQTLCLPVRKLPAYLASINPKKVREELRPKIELYQAESDDALWNYWMTGRAERPVIENGSITPSHRSELKAIVDAKLSTYPASVQGKARSEIWTRFNRNFKIAEYAQLPAKRMAEARDYLIELEVKALKKLPAADAYALPKALPPTDKESSAVAASTALAFRADFPDDMGSDRKEAMQQIERIARDMHTSFTVVRNIVRLGCHPGSKTMRMSLDEREAYETLHNLYTTADESLCAAYNALDAGYKLGRLYGRG